MDLFCFVRRSVSDVLFLLASPRSTDSVVSSVLVSVCVDGRTALGLRLLSFVSAANVDPYDAPIIAADCLHLEFARLSLPYRGLFELLA
jgi:hypothetical protein